jgi:hypothetical protein
MKLRCGAITVGWRQAPWLFDPGLAGCSLVLKARADRLYAALAVLSQACHHSLDPGPAGDALAGTAIGKDGRVLHFKASDDSLVHLLGVEGMDALRFAPLAPSQIIVFPFATSTADVTLNQGLGARLYANYEGENQTAEHAQLAHATAQNICVQVASSFLSNGWNAVCQPRGTPVTGSNTLIIDGAFTDISQGFLMRFSADENSACSSLMNAATTEASARGNRNRR